MPLKIDKKVLVGHELEIDELREKIGKFSLKNNPKLPEYTRLVSSSETDWDWDQVKTMLTQDPSAFAPLESNETLLSAGIGLELRIRHNLTIRTDWARALLSTSPNASEPVRKGNNEFHFLFSLVY